MIFLHALRRTRRAPESLARDGLRTNEFAVVHERTRRADEEHPPCDLRNPGHHLQGAKIHERNSPSFTNKPPQRIKRSAQATKGTRRHWRRVSRIHERIHARARANPTAASGRGKGAGTTRRKGARGLERSMVSAGSAIWPRGPARGSPDRERRVRNHAAVRMLRPLIRIGRLTVIDADGQRARVRQRGRARRHGPPARSLAALEAGAQSRPACRRGLDGRHADGRGRRPLRFPRTVRPQSRRPPAAADQEPVGAARAAEAPLPPAQHAGRSERNVAHHYDLSGELYELFLDSERQYTCAYHPTGTEDIETAQRAKERHIAAKLLLEPGHAGRSISAAAGAGSPSIWPATTTSTSPA